MLMLKGRPILNAVPMQTISSNVLAPFPVGRMPIAPRVRMMTAGIVRLHVLIAALLRAVSLTAQYAASLETPAICSSLMSEHT